MQTRRPLFFVVLFAVVVAIAVPVFAAFSNPLSTTAIRDAYFIGTRNDKQTKDFLAQYVRQFPQLDSGIYVSQIGIDTPFTQVVQHSELALNYHAPDAVEEFEAKPLSLIVNVDVTFTSEYPTTTGDAPQLAQWVPDFWNDFKVHLIQGQEIKPTTVRGGPVYAYGWKHMPFEDRGRPHHYPSGFAGRPDNRNQIRLGNTSLVTNIAGLWLGVRRLHRSAPCPWMKSNASSTVRVYFDSTFVYWNFRCGENFAGSNAPRFTWNTHTYSRLLLSISLCDTTDMSYSSIGVQSENPPASV
jgi:hypothetical protein